MSPGPHAVILVVGIGRYGDQERDTANLFLHWFGKEMLNFFYVVFTGLDDLEEDETFDDIIKTATPDLQNLLKLCNNRYMAFGNKRPSCNPNQASELLDMVDRNIKGDCNRFYSNSTFEKIELSIKESGLTREEFIEGLIKGTAIAITFLSAPIWLPLYVAKKLIDKMF